VWVAERAVYRRLISLICAGWLPHDNRFVGELPRSKFEGHPVAGRLVGLPRILPPLPLLLPTHCIMSSMPYALTVEGDTVCPIAQINPASSRAMAVQACTFNLPRASNSR